jgi:hypothetical protein
MKPSDPAYWMLEEGLSDPSKRSTPTVHRDGCYICDDPEFSLMGLPLCFGCHVCGEHVAADDCVCEECGHDHSEPPDITIAQATAWSSDGGRPFEEGWWFDNCDPFDELQAAP